jgi:hypothetical protein
LSPSTLYSPQTPRSRALVEACRYQVQDDAGNLASDRRAAREPALRPWTRFGQPVTRISSIGRIAIRHLGCTIGTAAHEKIILHRPLWLQRARLRQSAARRWNYDDSAFNSPAVLCAVTVIEPVTLARLTRAAQAVGRHLRMEIDLELELKRVGRRDKRI